MKWMHRIFYALMFLPLVVTLIVLPVLPDRVPMHYNIRGEVDRWGSKYENLIFPAVVIATGLVLKSASKMPSSGMPSRKRDHDRDSQERLTILVGIFTLLLFNGMTYFFLYLGYVRAKPDLTQAMDLNKTLFIILGFILIGIGSIMPRLKMNSLIGLRTTWSMANERAWSLSQRFGGTAMILTGILIIIGCAFIFEGISCFFFGMGLLLLSGLASVIYSYFAYKKTQNM